MNDSKAFRRIMICAPGSGSGKTLITCALIRILMRKGYAPASFKCGPDYIDPMFHRSILGIPSRNLDLFLAGKEGVLHSLAKGFDGRDFGILEGVMGFFDGTSAAGTEGSSYEISCVTNTPAIMVVNTKGMSSSIVPSIKGFCEYGEEKRIKGIILNNISPSIAADISEKIIQETGIPVIATLPVLKDAGLQSRHLGLVLPGEIPGLLQNIDRVADELEKNLDFGKLINIADTAGELDISDLNRDIVHCKVSTRHVRIGVARDEAFCFYYEDNLELLQQMGATLVFFSPLHDEKIPDVDRLIIGGGYPELYAKELSMNSSMLRSIKEAAEDDLPILAECGGFLYLLESLKNPEGEEFKMAGVFSGKSQMKDKLSHFGYVNVTSNTENNYLHDGEDIKGHEFHYYEVTEEGDICKMTKPSGKRSWVGCRAYKNVFSGFAHLYYPSCVPFMERFIDA